MKIAIVGTAPSSNMMAPFDDPDWDVWACSMANMDVLPPSVQTWFELHHLDLIANGAPKVKTFIAFLAQKQAVYVSKPDPRLPNATVLDRAECFRQGGALGHSFMTSTIAWMLAYAISKQPEEIGIYGVDMAATEEYGHQRPGCHYWVDRAIDRGIKIRVPVESDLLEPAPLYGFCHHDPMWRKLDLQRQELEQRKAACESRAKQGDLEAAFLKGAIEQNIKDSRTYTGERQNVRLT